MGLSRPAVNIRRRLQKILYSSEKKVQFEKLAVQNLVWTLHNIGRNIYFSLARTANDIATLKGHFGLIK